MKLSDGKISRFFLIMPIILLLIYTYIHLSGSIPVFEHQAAYSQRAEIYKTHQRLIFLLLTPAALMLAYLTLGFDRSRRGFNRIIQRFDTMSPQYFTIIIPVIYGVVCAWTAYWILGATPRILDGFNYLFQAQNFALGQTSAKIPPAQDLFRFPFIIMDNGKWYGSVYPGYPFLLMFGVMAGVPWLVNPVIGSISIFLIYKLGRLLFGETSGRLAALLASISPFFRMMCAIHMSHAAATMWVLFTVWFFSKWIRDKKQLSAAFWAGISLGQLYLTRPQAACVLMMPFLIAGAFFLIRRRITIRQLSVFVLPLIGFYLLLDVYNVSLTGDPKINPRYYVDPGRRLGFGEDIGEPLPGGIRGGHSFEKGVANVLLLMNLMNSDLLGTGSYGVAGICSILLIPALFLKPFKWIEWIMGAGISLNFLLYLFYYTASPNFGPRYLAESIPWTIYLMIRGVVKLSRIFEKWDLSEIVLRFSVFSGLWLLALSFAFFLPIHTMHYGILPETLKRSQIKVPEQCVPAIVIIPKSDYRMNVFTWNSPNLNGNIFVRGGDESLLEELIKSRPDHSVIHVIFSKKDSPAEITGMHCDRSPRMK